MVEFIKKSGQERVKEIEQQADNDFNVGKEQHIEAEKKRLTENFANKLNNEEIRLKIAKSAEQNKERIERMIRIQEMVQNLLEKTKQALYEKMQEDPETYRKLMKDLLVQGLIKLYEKEVTLRCRESDVEVLESVMDEAVAEYKQLMLSECKALQGQTEIKCKVTVDRKRHLPEWDELKPEGTCLGGFLLLCRKNRIVCSQTLEDRVKLAYDQAIPMIRRELFPSMDAKRE